MVMAEDYAAQYLRALWNRCWPRSDDDFVRSGELDGAVLMIKNDVTYLWLEYCVVF